jgi:catechol 2,3-dioxygenase-like lactoylglutathione lyase family enzyme
MVTERKARVVGVNHVALEVGDIEEALAFYGRLFDFKLRGKSSTSAFIDLGDQFLALQKGRTQPADDGRHFGLVVDDKDAVRKALATPGSDRYPGRSSTFSTRGAIASRFTVLSLGVRCQFRCQLFSATQLQPRLFAMRSAPFFRWREGPPTHGGGLWILIHGTPPGPHPSVQLNRCAVSRRHRLRSAPFVI